MPILFISFFCGTLCIFFLQDLPPMPLLLTISLMLVGILLILVKTALLIKIGSAFLLGLLYLLSYLQLQFAWQLPNELINQPVLIKAYIKSIPVKKPLSQRLQVKVIELDGTPQSFNAALNWYHNAATSNEEALKVGQLWEWQVKLRPPRGLANPAGFNYEAWLLAQNIHAVGYIIGKHTRKLASNPGVRHQLNHTRQNIHEKLQQILDGHPMGGLIQALTIGEKSLINASQWQVLRSTGTNHLMAISGLHIGLIAVLFYRLFFSLWRLWPTACLRLPAPKVGAIAAISSAFIYAALAGFSIPTQRALIMVLCFMGNLLGNRHLTHWYVWSLALFLVVLIDPLASLAVGFWLSFAAVAWIIYGLSGRLNAGGHWWKYGRTQWVVCLGLLPLGLLFFQQLSLSSFVANLITIPWISFIVVPMALAGTTLINSAIGAWLLERSADSLGLMWHYLTFLSQLHWSTLNFALPHNQHYAGLILASLLLLAPRGWPGKSLGLILFICIFNYKVSKPAYGTAEVTILDVGQGLASVIRTRNHTLVYDTGPSFNEGFDAGEALILPYLRQLQTSQLDKVIISHQHNDHNGGLAALQRGIAIRQIISNQFHSQCKAGQQWRWDGVDFAIVYPIKYGAKIRQNNDSCVLRIATAKQRILFSGDIELAAERELVRTKSDIAANILVVPHHGSRTSSSPDFLDAVNMQMAIFSSGYYNRYQFPHTEVAQRYRDKNVMLYNTATSGAIHLILAADDYSITQQRIDNKRIWQRYNNTGDDEQYELK